MHVNGFQSFLAVKNFCEFTSDPLCQQKKSPEAVQGPNCRTPQSIAPLNPHYNAWSY